MQVLQKCWQSGFRSLHPNEATLLHSARQFSVDMKKGLIYSLINGFLFLDLKKNRLLVFDIVDHKF